jgi:hypothetical protein
MEENSGDWIVELRQTGVAKSDVQRVSAAFFEFASYMKG